MYKKYFFILYMCLSAVGHSHAESSPESSLKYSDELMRELHDFIDLIPSVTVDALVAKHMLIDGGFRKALLFLRSGDFKQLVQLAEQLPEVIEIINFLHLNDNSSSGQGISNTQYNFDYESSYSMGNNKIETVIVLLKRHDDLKVPQKSVNLQSFTSFVQELLTHLPRDSYVAMINEKRKRCGIFAKFYEALRSEQFKAMVETALKSKNVNSIIRTLSSHDIDAQSLKSIGFEVISWGPAV